MGPLTNGMTVAPSPSSSGSVIWLACIVASTFTLLYMTSARRRIGRPATRILVALLAVTLSAAYVAWARIDVATRLTGNVGPGLAAGSAAGLLAGVAIAAATHRLVGRPSGTPLLRALALDGVFFGTAEGLLLNALPALVGWQLGLLIATGGLWPWAFGLAASTAAVVADHLAYPETRHSSIVLGVGLAGAALAAVFLATGSIVAPLIGHSIIHLCVTLRGGEQPPYGPAENVSAIASIRASSEQSIN